MRIVEAFLAGTFIIVILVLVVSNQNSQTDNISSQIYNSEISIIRYIELNNSLRGNIISVSPLNLPLNSDNSSFPSRLNDSVNSRTPAYLTCESQICRASSTCDYWKGINKDVYAKEVIITANLTDYNPRKFKLFCFSA